MSNPTSHILRRLAVGIGLPIACLALVLTCYFLQATPPCIFYELTGLYCFGCGAGRALLAILRLDIATAFRNNPLLLLLAPFIAYFVLKKYIAFVFSRDILPFPTVRGRFLGIFIIVLLLAFVILRTIPLFPFDLLAPLPPAA